MEMVVVKLSTRRQFLPPTGIAQGDRSIIIKGRKIANTQVRWLSTCADNSFLYPRRGKRTEWRAQPYYNHRSETYIPGMLILSHYYLYEYTSVYIKKLTISGANRNFKENNRKLGRRISDRQQRPCLPSCFRWLCNRGGFRSWLPPSILMSG